jgi:hypothetical protein
MGGKLSTLPEMKVSFERMLSDKKRQLTRILSKSNSMESLDKAEVSELKFKIRQTESVLDLVNRAIEDQNAPSF